MYIQCRQKSNLMYCNAVACSERFMQGKRPASFSNIVCFLQNLRLNSLTLVPAFLKFAGVLQYERQMYFVRNLPLSVRDNKIFKMVFLRDFIPHLYGLNLPAYSWRGYSFPFLRISKTHDSFAAFTFTVAKSLHSVFYTSQTCLLLQLHSC